MKHVVSSPDDNVELAVTLRDRAVGALTEAGTVHYSLRYEGEQILDPSPLGIDFARSPALDDDLTVVDTRTRAVDDTWEPTWGRTERVRNRYTGFRLDVRERLLPHRELGLSFRVYDDGIGFRYEFMGDGGTVNITSENTSFRFAGDFTSWWIPAGTRDYEALYRETPVSAVTDASTPITLRTDAGTHLAVHEAHLFDYADMELVASESGPSLQSDLVALPDGVKVQCELPHTSPWRTIQIGERPGELIESNLIENLNPPTALDDDDWIQPGTYLGVWWALHKGAATWGPGPDRGATTETVKEYVDFAAEHDVPYVLAEGWNVGWETYGVDKELDDPDSVDFTTPHEDFDLEEVLTYCEQRDVEFLVHNETFAAVDAYEDRLEDAFTTYREWGVPGVKTGYVGQITGGHSHHDQRMVNHHHEVITTAAANKLLIDAHEPIKPTGQYRTYPNFVTFEGVRGMEYNAWSEGNPPAHTVTIPFTRMLAGPLDYTPGIFALEWNPDEEGTRVHTTRARQLALYPILFSPLQMLADLPEHYADERAFEFLEAVPTDWDETRVLDAVVGEYIAIARRSGEEWFLGIATDENPRTIAVPLDFLDERDYLATVYADGPEADFRTDPTPISVDQFRVNATATLDASLAPGGGQAARLAPTEASEETDNPAYRRPRYAYTFTVPDTVSPHEPLNVSVKIENEGVLPGGEDLSIEVQSDAGETVDRLDLGYVRLGPGESSIISFSTVPSGSGIYQINIDDRTTTVPVE